VEVGDVVTYSYLLSVTGAFRNPKILRKRSDLPWDDLVHREKYKGTSNDKEGREG
jgi:hypothetical protein